MGSWIDGVLVSSHVVRRVVESYHLMPVKTFLSYSDSVEFFDGELAGVARVVARTEQSA